MRTLKFSILVQAIDSYIYSGHFFLILENGDLVYTPISDVMRKLIDKYPKFENLIRVSFQRNDYLSNRQGTLLFGIGEIKKSFIELWEKASTEMVFEVPFERDDFTFIANIPTMPVLDMKLYAMRLYIGTKKGLYEIKLNSDDKYHLHPSKLKKKFDTKITGLNAKSGEVIISANSEGLFHGSFLNLKDELNVIERPVAKKSLRTGWSSYDIINYEENNRFEYFVNETEKLENKPNFSRFDEYSERRRITNFGSSKYNISKLLERSQINYEEIIYSFNSSTSSFFFMKNGSFINVNMNKKEKNDFYFTSRNHILPNLQKKFRKYLKPISTSIVPKGCVVEYYDKVVLYQNSKAKIIETEPSISVRTYPSSIRYRNLISITKDNEISFHSIFPFDELPVKLTIEDFEGNNIFNFI